LEENTLFVLTASNGNPDEDVRLTREVIVNPAPVKPEILTFAANPTSVTRGQRRSVTLSWEVSGNPANLELTGPDIGTLPLDPTSKEFTVEVGDEALFTLTAYTGDLKDSAIVRISGVDPQIPLPTIKIFVIASPGAPKVRKINDTTYEVQVNTTVNFSWEVEEANEAILRIGGVTIGNGAPFGSAATIVTGAGEYSLTAINTEGRQVEKRISVTVVNQPSPNRPVNFTGIQTSNNENELRWDWVLDPEKSDIIGFRLYRANIGSDNFAIVADENDLPKGTEFWVDKIVPACDRIYFVVAVYVDLQGNRLETTASNTSWESNPCTP
jgi:hypothetical protein